MKGIASIIEVVITGMILILAFYYFFPRYTIESNWGKVLLETRVMDVLNTIDRLELTETLARSDAEFGDFMGKVFHPVEAEVLVSWKDTRGLLNEVKVACYGCEQTDIDDLSSWLSGHSINGRTITFTITAFSDFNQIPDSNVLLIYDETLPLATVLDPNKNILKNYISLGKGLVEVGDVTNENQMGEVQSEIFGLAYDEANLGSIDYNIVLMPPEMSRVLGLYYYFYNIPLMSVVTEKNIVICDESLFGSGCDQDGLKGKFVLMGGQIGGSDEYSFWIYGTVVYFDTDADGDADSILSAGETFSLTTQLGYDEEFKLKAIDMNSINLVFIPDFRFDDMLKPDSHKVRQADDDDGKVFIKTDTDIPVVVANVTSGRTVWMPYLAKKEISDDEKLLLMSSLFWSAERSEVKGTIPSFSSGHRKSMIDVVGTDVLEIYTFSLGLGYPF